MDRYLTYSRVQEYLISLVPPRNVEFQQMEAFAEQQDFPIIGPAAGYACYLIARMVAAQRVFEMGSGYGYSTAWFAKAVQENGGGVVHHTVWDDKLSKMAHGHLTRLGFENLIQFHTAEAVETLERTPGPFDLIFNDINKEAYPGSLGLIKSKLRSGGVLLVDNLLWNGRIFDPSDTSPATEAIREFTRLVTTDSEWIVSLLPIRDGLVTAYKK